MNNPEEIEKALSELAWASSNYLEYLANPRAFVGEPRHLLLENTQKAFELLKKSEGKTIEEHWIARNAEAQSRLLSKAYEDIDTVAMMR